jgi:hypothetical protein
MAVVPDKPVRIREHLSDGTAYDATVTRYEEVDSVEVLEDEPTTDAYGEPRPVVYYTADEAKKLKPAKKAAASKEEASK